jgi:hypothetical protein
VATDLLSAVEALLPRRRLFPLKKQLSRTRRVKDPTIDDVRHNQNYSCQETANQLPHPTRGSAWPTYASPAAARPRSRAAHSAPVKLCPLGTRARRLHPTQPLKLDPRCNRTRVGSRLLRASWGGGGVAARSSHASGLAAHAKYADHRKRRSVEASARPGASPDTPEIEVSQLLPPPRASWTEAGLCPGTTSATRHLAPQDRWPSDVKGQRTQGPSREHASLAVRKEGWQPQKRMSPPERHRPPRSEKSFHRPHGSARSHTASIADNVPAVADVRA